jgi:hypothetical protein
MCFKFLTLKVVNFAWPHMASKRRHVVHAHVQRKKI